MKRIGLILILCLLLCGCTKAEPQPAARVVTGVQVEFLQNGQLLRRSYTKAENVRAVLNYLRILDPYGPVTPESATEDGCRITLQFSHGPDRVFLQQGNDYLSRDNGSWETIDSARATLLYPLLLLLPSDE